MSKAWPNEIDGRMVLRRILADRGRIRMEVVNLPMAESAERTARELLTLPNLSEAVRAQLTHIHTRLVKVIAARRRNRS